MSFVGFSESVRYSLIAAKEVGGIRLVCCRNPWGNEKEWFGPWCDASKEWEENPDVAEALNVNFKGDGLWWMEWEDLVMPCVLKKGLKQSVETS